MRIIFLSLTFCVALTACSQSRQLKKPYVNDTSATASFISNAQQVFTNDTALAGAHVGISIYDPTVSRYLYNYQGDKYFVPASNTKLFTCYAAMKYLGDSLVGAKYQNDCDTAIDILATGDPTFLHPDFPNQPVLNFLRNQNKPMRLFSFNWKDSAYGKGWGWDDYNDYYAAERSPFPVAGNTVRLQVGNYDYGMIEGKSVYLKINWLIKPAFFSDQISNRYNLPFPYGLGYGTINDSTRRKWLLQFAIRRSRTNNDFFTVNDTTVTRVSAAEIPFITEGAVTGVGILQKDYQLNMEIGSTITCDKLLNNPDSLFSYTIHSQPTDSLLKPMMHRSDNFFAEQSLLMVSNEKLGYMNDEAIIDTLLKTDLKDLPQKPVWVDGSGLSRYNLFTPQDMVAVLLKIKNEFGLERIRNILPKGNTGTLTNYYQQIGPAIFAKTGSLSGQVALSGYLTCKTDKLLLFSVMINNYTNSGRAVRRAIEKFLLQVWEHN